MPNASTTIQDEIIDRQHQDEDVAQSLLVKYLMIFHAADDEIAATLSHYLNRHDWSRKQQESLSKKLREIEDSHKHQFKDEFMADFNSLGRAEADYILKELAALGVPDELLVYLDSFSVRNLETPLILDKKSYPIIPFMDTIWDVRWEIMMPLIATAFSTDTSMGQVMEFLFSGDAPAMKTAENALQMRVFSAVDYIVNQARMELYGENDNLIAGYMWNAIMDDRTCVACGDLHGKVRSMDERVLKTTLPTWAYPPLHRRCRCVLVPVFKRWEKIKGGDEMPKDVRVMFDGKLPEEETYAEWFEKQPKATKIRILGKRKYEMYESGEVAISQFSRNGHILTLKQLDAFLGRG